MIGRVLGGRYEILEPVDSGGMAYIYKARCRKSDQIVAIKVLKHEFSDKPEYVKRFKKEAEAALSLEHPNIVAVRDIGCDDGVYYIVMDFIDGPTLKTVVNQKGPLCEKEALGYAIQICSALSAAHKKGIIHRDVKPHNMLIDKDGTVKVTDFGIATSISAPLEEDDEVIGSVHYISPEQARGEAVDARSDIYSLGIMLYEMLTGELPYTGDKTVSVALRHINEQITPPIRRNPAVSRSASNIVLKAACKNRKDRYRSMDAFKEDLICALVDKDGEFVELPASCRGAETPPQTSGQQHRRWKIAVLAGLLVLLAALVTAGVTLLGQSSTPQLTMPDLSGLDVEAATQQLASMGMSASILYEESDTVAEGRVIRQTPAAGSVAEQDQSVVLTLSSGPPALLMPGVTGKTLEEAQTIVEQTGLFVESLTYELSTDMPAGLVIRQTPEEDSEVRPGDAVRLVISTATETDQMPMPSVTNILVDQAVEMLSQNGFSLCFVYENDNELAEGTVYEQSPGQGIPVHYTDEINLWISRYKTKDYQGYFVGTVEIADRDSKVKLVLETVQDGVPINYVVWETQAAEVGPLSIEQGILSLTEETKTVRVYVNNVETLAKEVRFVERES